MTINEARELVKLRDELARYQASDPGDVAAEDPVRRRTRPGPRLPRHITIAARRFRRMIVAAMCDVQRHNPDAGAHALLEMVVAQAHQLCGRNPVETRGGPRRSSRAPRKDAKE